MLTRLSAKDIPGFGTPLLAVGMAILAIYNYRPWLEQRIGFGLSFLDNRIFLFIGIALAIVGFMLIIIWLIALIIVYMVLSNLRNIINNLPGIKKD
jgi:hypothetical protein